MTIFKQIEIKLHQSDEKIGFHTLNSLLDKQTFHQQVILRLHFILHTVNRCDIFFKMFHSFQVIQIHKQRKGDRICMPNVQEISSELTQHKLFNGHNRISTLELKKRFIREKCIHAKQKILIK